MAKDKPSITVSPRADESQWDPNDVIAKRLAGAPFGVKTDEIPLKEPGRWQLYIASSQVNEGRHYEMTRVKGWVPFTKDQLADGISPESLGFRVAEDGNTLVRGVRGDEVLYMMPKATYEQIQMRKAESNTKGMRSEKAAKADVAEAAAAAHGAEAAEFIANNGKISIRDTVTGA